MAVTEFVWVNGMSPSDLGAAGVRVLSGDAMMQAIDYDRIDMVNSQGGALSGLSKQGSREFEIVYRFDPSAVEARGAEIATLLDNFVASSCEIRMGDDPDAVLDAVLVSVDRTGLSDITALLNGPAWLRTRWLAPVPSKRARYPHVVSFTTGRVLLSLGNLPSSWELWVYGDSGPVTDPTVTVRNRAGTVLKTMSITATLDANDYVRIQSDGRCFESDNGTETEDHSILAAVNFPVLDPRVGASFEVDDGEGLIVWHNRWAL